MIYLPAACVLCLYSVAVSADILQPHPPSGYIHKYDQREKEHGDSRLELPATDHPGHSQETNNKWPYCPTLREIRDQGSCRSCWAFGAVETMTDRVCIYSNGIQHFHFSAQDLVSCCTTCGFGCDGGVPRRAWEYWKHYGIVSVGNYNASQGCKPYEIPPCEHHVRGGRLPCSDDAKTPKYQKICREGNNVSYKHDKQYGKHVYSVKGGEQHIRAELFKNGQVEAALLVYADLLIYKSGVCQHVQRDFLGGHAVKIIGWGVENGHKYWLVANSWNTD